MLRISQRRSGDHIVVCLGGDLTAETVDTLRARLAGRGPSQPTGLDLAELRFLDGAGAQLLVEAELSGCEIDGASPYVELLIERHRPAPVPTMGSNGQATDEQSDKNKDQPMESKERQWDQGRRVPVPHRPQRRALQRIPYRLESPTSATRTKREET